MAYYEETDPLLPGDKRAPEIHGSKASSVTNELVTEVDGEDQETRIAWRQANFLLLALSICVTLLVVILLSTGLSFDPIFGDGWPKRKTIDQRVDRILRDTPLIDGHNDLAILIRVLYDNKIYSENFTRAFEDGGMLGQVDLPRLKQGKNGGAFWSAFVPCPANGSDFSDENYAGAVAFTLSQIDLITRLQAAYPTRFSRPPNSSTAISAFKSGQLISPLGIEGLHQIGNSFSNLRLYYSLGARYVTLTHNCHNIYADAAITGDFKDGFSASNPYWGGVSPAGRVLIHEMNRLGMIVDLSHVSANTMRDVLGGGGNGGGASWTGSAAPIIFSHSSAYAICPHPRNVPDDVLMMVKRKNGVVMVNFSPDFVSCVRDDKDPIGTKFYPRNNTLEHVVTHIRHIGELIGYDHVGLGSDFDGIESTPKGLEDVSKFPDLVAELLKQGISDEDAGKIVGGNVLRVWRDVEKVALDLKDEKPAEDNLPPLWKPDKVSMW